MRKRPFTALAVLICAVLLPAGCGKASDAPDNGPAEERGDVSQVEQAAPGEPDEVAEDSLLVAAAASLEYSFRDMLIPLFQEQYPHIKVEGTYDSSGKLQAQIEAGLEADVFMSAAVTQMNNLLEQDLIAADTVTQLLENRIVLIAAASSDTAISSFAGMVEAESIAQGDPDSVPAGQYAKEALTSLGIYDEVAARASLGTNVTEVLNWVSEGSADVGIVYATDAATTDRVKILAEAPEGSLAQKVLYPVGMVASTRHPEEARLFLDFLRSPQALAVFADYGFTPNQ